MKRSRFCCTDNFQGRSCWLEASPKKREDLVMQFGFVFNLCVQKPTLHLLLIGKCIEQNWLCTVMVSKAWNYGCQIHSAFLLSQRYTVNNNSCLDFPSQDCVCFVSAFGFYPPSVGRKMPFWLKWTPPPLLNSKQEIEYACFS